MFSPQIFTKSTMCFGSPIIHICLLFYFILGSIWHLAELLYFENLGISLIPNFGISSCWCYQTLEFILNVLHLQTILSYYVQLIGNQLVDLILTFFTNTISSYHFTYISYLVKCTIGLTDSFKEGFNVTFPHKPIC